MNNKTTLNFYTEFVSLNQKKISQSILFINFDPTPKILYIIP